MTRLVELIGNQEAVEESVIRVSLIPQALRKVGTLGERARHSSLGDNQTLRLTVAHGQAGRETLRCYEREADGVDNDAASVVACDVKVLSLMDVEIHSSNFLAGKY